MRKYPRMYQISCQQQQLIQQVGSHTETTWEWKFQWRRPLFDNEVDTTIGFLEDTSRFPIHRHLADCWVWKSKPNGHYSTRSAYHLMQHEAAEANTDPAFVEIWKLKIPAKAAIFAWRLVKDRLHTKDNLRRRQIQLNDTLCPFCRNYEEEASHLFFSCTKTQSLSWINTSRAFSANPRHHFLQHTTGLHGSKQYSR